MEQDIFIGYLDSPLGEIEIGCTHAHVVWISFPADEIKNKKTERKNHWVTECKIQLSEYFDGKREKFELIIRQSGTDFQQRVWNELQQIEFGKTLSYLSFSKRLGDEKAIRAVASANGANNVAIVIPCHRVIGSDGKLTGYAGGLWRKQWLLDHEAKQSGTFNRLF